MSAVSVVTDTSKECCAFIRDKQYKADHQEAYPECVYQLTLLNITEDCNNLKSYNFSSLLSHALSYLHFDHVMMSAFQIPSMSLFTSHRTIDAI